MKTIILKHTHHQVGVSAAHSHHHQTSTPELTAHFVVSVNFPCLCNLHNDNNTKNSGNIGVITVSHVTCNSLYCNFVTLQLHLYVTVITCLHQLPLQCTLSPNDNQISQSSWLCRFHVPVNKIHE